MIHALGETLNLGLGLLTSVLLFGALTTALTSPIIMAGWALGFGREIFSDQSEQAQLVITIHFATTGIEVALLLWLGSNLL